MGFGSNRLKQQDIRCLAPAGSIHRQRYHSDQAYCRYEYHIIEPTVLSLHPDCSSREHIDERTAHLHAKRYQQCDGGETPFSSVRINRLEKVFNLLVHTSHSEQTEQSVQQFVRLPIEE